MAERSVLIVQNISREGPGTIAEVLQKRGIKPTIIDLSLGEHFPPPDGFGAVVVLGGPDSANDTTPKMLMELYRIRETIDKNIPYLGICLGMQALVKAAGGEVTKSPVREIGFIGPGDKPFTITLTEEGRKDPLFKGLGRKLEWFQLHGETVKRRSNVALLGTSEGVPEQIVKVGKNAYGIQAHPELTQEMLILWANEDPDLANLNARDLQKYFARIRYQYTETAWILFANFLEIARL